MMKKDQSHNLLARNFSISLTIQVFITVVMVFVAASARAMSPEYDSSRKWVEQHNPKDKTPASKRIFVVCGTNNIILRFREGITLREVIDVTPLKGTVVRVYIMKESKKVGAVFDEVVKPAEKPTFLMEPRQLLYIDPDDAMPRW